MLRRQQGFGLTGYIAAGGALAVLAVTVLWQAEKIKSIRMEGEIRALHGELDLMQQNLDTLKDSHAEQQKTILRLAENEKKANQNIQALQTRAFDAQAELYEATNTINRLRSTAIQRSTMDPYGSGNAAHDRLTGVLQQLAGAQGGDDQDDNGPNNASSEPAPDPKGTAEP